MAKKATVASIFISHSHRDAQLAKLFRNLLVNGIGLPKDKCFLSSDPDKQYESKDKHIELLKKLIGSNIRLALVTPNSLQSADCNAELGYMWANKDDEKVIFKKFLFKTPTDTLKFPFYLSDMIPPKFELAKALDDLKDSVSKMFHLNVPTSEWNEISTKFVNDIDTLVSHVPTSINYRSMGRFIDACDSFHRILFFNVQVSFDDWFSPELQTHLAIQDATTTRGQLEEVFNTSREDRIKSVTRPITWNQIPKYYGTPTARVHFVTHTREELVNSLNAGNRETQNFVDLALMHLFMATPLAVVTVDQLLGIMKAMKNPDKKDDIDFEENQLIYPQMLNLPTPEELNDPNAIEILREKLNGMVMRPGPVRNPGIDFALLLDRRQGNGSGKYAVWTGGIDPKNDMVYDPVDDKNKRPIFLGFGKRIEHAVFRSMDIPGKPVPKTLSEMLEGDVGTMSTKDAKAKARELLTRRHPCFGVFHGKGGKNPRLCELFKHVMKFVLPAHCPLHIMSEADGKCPNVFALCEK